jgi:hypothetical protein
VVSGELNSREVESGKAELERIEEWRAISRELVSRELNSRQVESSTRERWRA